MGGARPRPRSRPYDTAYGHSLRPCLAPPIAPRRRSVIVKRVLSTQRRHQRRWIDDEGEGVEDRGADDVGRRERDSGGALRAEDGDPESRSLEHGAVVGAVPDRRAALRAQLSDEASLVLAVRDRAGPDAEVGRDGLQP